MPEDFTKTAKGETVTFWRAELEKSWDEWEAKEATRQELRKITSDYELEEQLFPYGDDGPDGPVIDQRDYHIIPRFKDRLMAIGGDEKPEVRMPRALSGFDQSGKVVQLSKVGEIQDRLAMLAMSMAGAPEEYEDGMGAIVTEGITAHWWEMTGLPDAAEEAQARQSPDEIMEAAKAGRDAPGRLQDSAEIGAAMGQAAVSDPRAAEVQFVTHPDGESPTERVIDAGAAHIDDAAREESGYPFHWRDGRFKIKCTRYPVGKWFRMDSRVWRHKDMRWMARLIPMEAEEARTHPAFRPSVAKDLKTEVFESENVTSNVTAHALPEDSADTNDDAMGRVLVWHILDKKHGREYFLGNEGDKFLADRPAPNLDTSGRPILRAAGRYGGFFPVSLQWGKMPTRNDAQKLYATPLAMPGLKGAKLVVKLISYYNHAVKQASVGYNVVDEDLFEGNADLFERNEGGIVSRPAAAASKDARPLMEFFGWKPPPVELYALIRDEVSRTLEDLDFPALDFALTGQEDTATQEQIAANVGKRGAFEIIRQSEVSYAISAHICMAMVRHNFSDADMDELIGAPDRTALQEVWAVVGQPRELPEATFAPKSRNHDLARSKLLFDAHERLKVEVDPITGAQTRDSSMLLDEALISLGVGKLPAPELTEEQKVIMAKARLMAAAEMQAAEQQTGAATSNGKTRDTEGKPRGRRERAGRRDSPRGRGRGERAGSELSAAQNRGPT